MCLRYAVTALFLLFITSTYQANAQTDTLRLNFQDAEKRFLQSNFDLLAQKYNVESAKALIEQARQAPKPRAKSRLNRVGKVQRLKGKKVRGTVKANRGKIDW